jgi:zinc/manganese transport system substrate-binding protein
MRCFAICCFLFPATAGADLKVVTTTPDLAALTRAVGGDKVSVTSLALPTQDPHFVDAKPSLALELNKADLLVVVGADLEVGWLPSLQTSARNAAIQTGGSGYLDASTCVTLLEIPDRPVDRSHGDIHPGGNPHYLHDPRAAAQVAKCLAKKLGELDADNAKVYAKNLRSFLASLTLARKNWEKRLAAYKGEPFIEYHRSWAYLAGWLGFVEVAFIEPKPGIPPTPRHIAAVIKVAKKRGVRVIIQESFYPDASAAVLAKKIPARLVVLPAGADVKGGQSYIERMDALVAALEQALGAE